MFANGPVGQPTPRFLTAQTRPMGGAPTILTPPPPPAPSSLIANSPAGPSISANLYALGTTMWNFLRELFGKVRAMVVAHVG
jgi:hypothetical protein